MSIGGSRTHPSRSRRATDGGRTVRSTVTSACAATYPSTSAKDPKLRTTPRTRDADLAAASCCSSGVKRILRVMEPCKCGLTRSGAAIPERPHANARRNEVTRGPDGQGRNRRPGGDRRGCHLHRLARAGCVNRRRSETALQTPPADRRTRRSSGIGCLRAIRQPHPPECRFSTFPAPLPPLITPRPRAGPSRRRESAPVREERRSVRRTAPPWLEWRGGGLVGGPLRAATWTTVVLGTGYRNRCRGRRRMGP